VNSPDELSVVSPPDVWHQASDQLEWIGADRFQANARSGCQVVPCLHLAEMDAVRVLLPVMYGGPQFVQSDDVMVGRVTA